jgi:alpha-glucosidase
MVDVGPGVFAWLRTSGTERLLAAVNFGAEPARMEGLPDEQGTLLVSTHPARAGSPAPAPIEVRQLTLQPDEAVLLRVQAADQQPASSPSAPS